MIVPQFKLFQTDEHLIIVIRLPYVKVSSSELYIDEFDFKFFL